MAAHETMRVRCPKDAPREADRHLAVDVRLPLPMTAIPRLLRALGRCPCGEKLVIDAGGERA
jgi:hypothetical protein